jgi:hypothetical protein
MTPVERCRACAADVSMGPIVLLPTVPVFCNVLADNEAAARSAPMGAIELVQCPSCGMMVNARFDPVVASYQPGYENSLHHSDTFESWACALAERLVRTYGLRDGTAVEVGCGGGGFLSLLCDAGMRRGIGYDPSYGGAVPRRDGIEIHNTLLDGEHGHRADLAVCRHVLEHVADPASLLQTLTTAAPDGVIYVEVPDATSMLTDVRIYDVIYEHCSYFAASALHALMARAGLQPVATRTEFGGQYLCVEARPGGAPRDVARDGSAVARLLDLGTAFGERTTASLLDWADRLARFARAGRDVVVWGAGSKGVTFVNIVEGGRGVSRLVDVNPLKRARFVPGTAQPVVAPADLAVEPPDVVILMNPVYEDEVRTALDRLGIDAELVTA